MACTSDFAVFPPNNSPTQVARAIDPATGIVTEAGAPATRATTWANYQGTIAGGGFDFQAHCVEANSAIIGI